MRDQQIRDLERRWRTSGETADQRAYIASRVRSGTLSTRQREFANQLQPDDFRPGATNWVAHFFRLGERTQGAKPWAAEVHSENAGALQIEGGLRAWLTKFQPFGRETLVRCALAAATRALPVLTLELERTRDTRDELTDGECGEPCCEDELDDGRPEISLRQRAQFEEERPRLLFETSHSFQLEFPYEQWAEDDDLMRLEERSPASSRIEAIRVWLSAPARMPREILEGFLSDGDTELAERVFTSPLSPGRWAYEASEATLEALLAEAPESVAKRASAAAIQALRALGGAWGAADPKAVAAVAEAVVEELSAWAFLNDSEPFDRLAQSA